MSRLSLLFLVFTVFGGAVALSLPSSGEVKPYPMQTSPLDGEVPLFIQEFSDIVSRYQQIPSRRVSAEKRVEIQRNLLARLNRMKPRTAFLEGQLQILSASLRFRLRVPGAEKALYQLAQESPEPSVRDDAVLTLVYQALKENNLKTLEHIYNETQHILSYQLKSFLALLLRPVDHITKEEAAYIIAYYAENIIDKSQDSAVLTRIINGLGERADIEIIGRIRDKFLMSGRPVKALPFIALHMEREEIPFQDVLEMGLRFGREEGAYAAMVQALPEKNEAMAQYLGLYQERLAARRRGRVYNTSLNRYRGTKKHPYNLEKTEEAFAEYVSGPMEDYYVTDNAERAVRNFLAFRRFDLIEKHLTQIKAQMWEGFYSPYISVQLAYARLQMGETNGAAEMLAEVVSKSPDTYFGMVSVELLNTLFRTSRGAEIRRSLFNNLRANAHSTNQLSQRIGAALAMYHIGNRSERSRAKALLISLGRIDESSYKNFSKEGFLLSEAYIRLGLIDSARRIFAREGISNPFEQEMIFSTLFEESEESYAHGLSQKYSPNMAKAGRIMGSKALKAYYPRPYSEHVSSAVGRSENLVDENLVYAIIRQESFYRTNARSHAGAQGLMQLMPATARSMARSVLKSTNYSLYDPKVNILLGTAYLSGNIKQLGLIPALAAYNGGPNRVKEIKTKYEPQNTFEFIEVHPIKETRNYMKKVLEHYNHYSVIYKGTEVDFSQLGSQFF